MVDPPPPTPPARGGGAFGLGRDGHGHDPLVEAGVEGDHVEEGGGRQRRVHRRRDGVQVAVGRMVHRSAGRSVGEEVGCRQNGSGEKIWSATKKCLNPKKKRKRFACEIKCIPN